MHIDDDWCWMVDAIRSLYVYATTHRFSAWILDIGWICTIHLSTGVLQMISTYAPLVPCAMASHSCVCVSRNAFSLYFYRKHAPMSKLTHSHTNTNNNNDDEWILIELKFYFFVVVIVVVVIVVVVLAYMSRRALQMHNNKIDSCTQAHTLTSLSMVSAISAMTSHQFSSFIHLCSFTVHGNSAWAACLLPTDPFIFESSAEKCFHALKSEIRNIGNN